MRACVALTLLMTLFVFEPVHAQETLGEDVFDMGLEDLMKVSIATREEVLESDAPGLITVITQEQIASSGARNLIDVLQMVPSFQFSGDYYGTISMGVRGLLALEGKLQFMIDGIEVNDLYYNGVLFSYSFPIHQVSRIEIIRGPGSVIYGSSAAYAVINIITLSGQELSGIRTTFQHGRMAEGLESDSLSLAYGNKYANGLETSVKVFAGNSGITDRELTYPAGPSSNGEDFFQKVRSTNSTLSYKGFRARFLSENIHYTSRDAYMQTLVTPANSRADTYAGQFEYRWKVTDSLTVTPTYSFKRSAPYQNDEQGLLSVDGANQSLNGYNFDPIVSRHRAFVPAQYQITSDLGLLFGLEYYQDRAYSPSYGFYPNPQNPSYNPRTEHFETFAGFAESAWKTSYGTLSAGGRYETHNLYGENIVPRFSWVKPWRQWNFKLLYSQAFRNPSIGNTTVTHSAGRSLVPEKTRVFELETSYRISKATSVTMGLFDIFSKRTVVYDALTGGYSNESQTGSYGAELGLKHASGWGFTNFGFSAYDGSRNKVTNYDVPQSSTQLAGFSNIKATWDTKYKITSSLHSQLSAIYIGERYSYSGDVNGDLALEVRKIQPVLTANLFFNYENAFVDGLQMGVGVMNLFDADQFFAMPYDLGRNTIPGPSREFLARVTYTLTTF